MTRQDTVGGSVIEVKFLVGCHIDSAAEQLVAAAEDVGSAWGFFNDVKLNATRGAKAEDVVADWHAENKIRTEAYERSEAGKKAAADREARRRAAQSKHDSLMQELPSLDFSDFEAVLDWVCQMQEPSDHVGVIVRSQTIAAAFEARGYKANENCGEAYKRGDRENMFRYLIGQALSGLIEGPAIHPIIHKFADQWRAQFGRAALKSAGDRE